MNIPIKFPNKTMYAITNLAAAMMSASSNSGLSLLPALRPSPSEGNALRFGPRRYYSACSTPPRNQRQRRLARRRANAAGAKNAFA